MSPFIATTSQLGLGVAMCDRLGQIRLDLLDYERFVLGRWSLAFGFVQVEMKRSFASIKYIFVNLSRHFSPNFN